MRALLLVLTLASALAGQVVEESFARDPGPLDFIRGEGLEQDILQALAGDTLVGLDAQGRVVPRLAERWNIRKGVLHLRLRGDATFTDGARASAADVRWTFEALQQHPQASPSRKALAEGVEVRGRDREVELRSALPPARLLLNLARLPIARQGQASVGSGPFSLVRQGADWRFTARAHFLKPAISGLHFRLVGEEQAVLLNLQKGWLTVGVPPARPGLTPPPTHRELHQPTHAQQVVWSRLGPGPLAALARWRTDAFPPGLFGAKARPSHGLWPETLGFPRRPVQASEPPLKGQTWELLYPAGDDVAQRAFLALRARAARDGVTLDLRPVDSALLYDRLQKGAFQLASALVLFDPHPWAVLEYLTPGGPMNFTGWSHPELAALLPRLDRPEAPDWVRLHALWAAAPGALPVLDYTSVVWVDRRLKVTPSPLGLYLSTPGAAGWTWTP